MSKCAKFGTDMQLWCLSHYTAVQRHIPQTRASQRLRPVAVSARLTCVMVQNSSGRQVVWCRRTMAMELAACFTAVVWQSLPIQKTVENVIVCQGLGWAQWFLLLGAGYKYSYLLILLTYNLLNCLVFQKIAFLQIWRQHPRWRISAILDFRGQ